MFPVWHWVQEFVIQTLFKIILHSLCLLLFVHIKFQYCWRSSKIYWRVIYSCKYRPLNWLIKIQTYLQHSLSQTNAFLSNLTIRNSVILSKVIKDMNIDIYLLAEPDNHVTVNVILYHNLRVWSYSNKSSISY
jgi:hypothetical protein